MEAINKGIYPRDILAVPHHLWGVFEGDELVQVRTGFRVWSRAEGRKFCPQICFLQRTSMVKVKNWSQKTGGAATESNSQNKPEPKNGKTTRFPHIVKVNLLSESDFTLIDFTALVLLFFCSVQTSSHSCLMCCYNLHKVRINSLWLEDPSVRSLKAEFLFTRL